MATEIGELVWKINGDTRNFDRNLKSSETGLKKFGAGIKKFAIGAAAAFAAVGVAKLGKEFVRAASDAEETTNKFNVVFRGLQDAAGAAEELAGSYGLSRTASQGLLADTADLLQGFGIAKDESLALSSEVQKLAVDLASFTNYAGGAQGASEALTKALLGERESVKQLGIAITDTELKRFAEEQGLVYEELDKGEQAFLTFELAVQQSGNAIGDFARSEKSFANQLRIAQANVENLKVSFGQGLLPLANLGVSSFNGLAGSLEDVADNFNAFVTSARGASVISSTLGTVAGVLSTITETLKIFFETGKDGLDGAFAPLIEAFGDIRDRASETGIVFDIFGGIVQYVSSFIRVLTTAIREQIEFIVQFGRTVVDSAELAVDALKSIFNKEIRDGLKAQAAEVGEAWVKTGAELVDVYTETFNAIKVEAMSFGDNAEETSNRLADAYERGFQRVKDASEEALLAAGGTGDSGTTPGEQAAEDEYQAWLKSYTEQLAARYAFEEETRQIVLAAEKQRTEDLIAEEERRKEIRQQATDAILGSIDSLYGSLSSLANTAAEDELNRLQEQINAHAEGSDERIALEEEYDKRSKELQREQAKRDKAYAIFSAIVSTAQAIIGFLANPGGIPGIVLSALAGVTGAVQVAAIGAQPLPFNDGGIVPGTSYAGDNVPARLNSKEMVLTEEQQAELFSLANGSGSSGGDTILMLDSEVLARWFQRQLNSGNITVPQRVVV